MAEKLAENRNQSHSYRGPATAARYPRAWRAGVPARNVRGALPAIVIRFDLPHSFLDVRAERDGFVLLGAFLLAWLFIRTSARLIRSPKVPWWPGSVKTSGGLHLHHLVWGIVLALFSGFLMFALEPASPWSGILAACFGIGAALTLDEFALWVHLEDVYWAPVGRESVDAVLVAAVLAGLIVLGLAPFDTSDSSPGLSLLLVVSIDLLVCLLAILKGRLLLAMIGVFVPPVSLIAGLRLAAPGSPWARRRYQPGGRKLARSQRRFARARARHTRLMNAIGGRPDRVGAEPTPAGARTAETAAAGKPDGD